MWIRGNILLINIRAGKIRIFIPIEVCVLRELLWQIYEMALPIRPLIRDRKAKAETTKVLEALPGFIEVLNLAGEESGYDLVDIDVGDEKKDKVKVRIKVW